MTVQDAYNSWSHTYDTDPNATRDLDAATLRRVLDELRAGQKLTAVIEAGCGTGKNTAHLAGVAEKLQALDFSEGMLAVAREKCRAHGNITFTVADLTQRWPCADHSAQLITCDLVLEHVADLGPVFAEAARVLALGGHLFVSELHPFRQYAGGVANFVRGDITTQIPAHVHHLTDFLEGARAAGLELQRLQEWWHDQDANKPPRLATFLFRKKLKADS